jgi:alcohol dehydrogenase
MSLNKHIVPSLRLYSGSECLNQLSAELTRLGSRRSVIICGASMIRESKALDLIRAAMGDLCVGVVDEVRAHSPLHAVEAAAHELHRREADSVVAVGGGSAIVTARAASILLAERGDARTLCTTRNREGVLYSPRLLAPKLPQLVIPTTPTTATLKAGSAVLDPSDGKRLALFDPKTRAKAVFVHPDLLETAPSGLTVSASLNTLTMGVEGLLSRSGDSFSDALLMHSVRLLVRSLPLAVSPRGQSIREDLMFASLMCGHATDYTGAGISIPLGHAVSARFHVDNGVTNAIVLPHAIRFNAEFAFAGIEKLANALGLFAGQGSHPANICDALCDLFRKLGLPTRLREIGVARESLAELATISMEDWFVRDNPRPVRGADELQAILELAW